MPLRRVPAGLALAISWASAASAQTPTEPLAEPPACYDAVVMATIASQVPTATYGNGVDYIVFKWPWILRLDVKQVTEGRVPTGQLTVITFQHAEYIRSSKPGRWQLRRNDVGGFNAVRETNLRRCPSDAPPASAFIHPGPGQTLADIEAEGRAYWKTD